MALNEAEKIQSAMAILGSRSSPRKRQACLKNLKLANRAKRRKKNPIEK